MTMTVTKFQRDKRRLGSWAKIIPTVVGLALLSGCVVAPAYGPGYYGGGYYASGYYYPHYRDRDDYYHRW
jgi:hypothetical protein